MPRKPSDRIPRKRKPSNPVPNPNRKGPGWGLRADVCESLAHHFGAGREIVKQAKVIIHFINTGEDFPSALADKPGLRLVDRGQ